MEFLYSTSNLQRFKQPHRVANSSQASPRADSHCWRCQTTALPQRPPSAASGTQNLPHGQFHFALPACPGVTTRCSSAPQLTCSTGLCRCPSPPHFSSLEKTIRTLLFCGFLGNPISPSSHFVQLYLPRSLTPKARWQVPVHGDGAGDDASCPPPGRLIPEGPSGEFPLCLISARASQAPGLIGKQWSSWWWVVPLN